MKVVVYCSPALQMARYYLAGVLALGGATESVGAEPQLADFAEGIELHTTTTRPLVELPLPDSVYTTVTHWDLADLRVFDSKSVAVPHAFCPAPTVSGTLATTALPVYGVTTGAGSANGAGTLTFTTANGAQLNVTATDNDSELRSGASFVLDTRAVDQPLHAVQLDWSTANGAAEIAVRVLASEDLKQWQTLVANAKLLHAKPSYGTTADKSQPLDQQRIALPSGKYQYLRVEPEVAGTELRVNQANAEYLIPAPAPSPTWFSAGAPHADEEATALLYESGHRVPVSYIRVLPSTENSRLHVSVQSRAQTSAPWQTQWSGEVYSIRFNNEERSTAPIKIAATSSPFWRLVFAPDAGMPPSAPRFDLGYLPLRLRFLAQGMGPYVLAYGSSMTITPSAVPCDGLLAGVSNPEKQQMLGTATLSEVKTLAGTSVLHAGRELPIRKLVLWAILLIGVGCIVAVSLSLLKRNRRERE